MRVRHFDRLDVRWDASTLRTNGDGSLTIDGFGAHVGPYTYHDDQGRPFIEHVPASTLFDDRSLESAAGSTLTIRHGPGLVTPDRFRLESHGSWVKAWDAGEGQLGVRVRVGSAEGIKFVREAASKGDPVELSPVYEVDVVERPTADGESELVQEGRDYSGIALLGPNEARGGTGTRLQLDSKTCAPEGTRIQVSAARLDSAPSSRLSFVAKDRAPMKKYTLKGTGGERAATKTLIDSLRALGKLPNLDAIETVAITATGPDGETDELSLPLAMWEAMLEGIGAGAPAAAPIEEAPAEEEIAMESRDADDEDEKLDAKVKKMVADAFAVERKANADATARAGSVNADARTILPPGYDYSVHWTQVCMDAIAKADPESEAQAKALAARARNADAVAEGMLRQMLADRRLNADGQVRLTVKKTEQDSNTNAWDSDTMPGREAKQ